MTCCRLPKPGTVTTTEDGRTEAQCYCRRPLLLIPEDPGRQAKHWKHVGAKRWP